MTTTRARRTGIAALIAILAAVLLAGVAAPAHAAVDAKRKPRPAAATVAGSEYVRGEIRSDWYGGITQNGVTTLDINVVVATDKPGMVKVTVRDGARTVATFPVTVTGREALTTITVTVTGEVDYAALTATA